MRRECNQEAKAHNAAEPQLDDPWRVVQDEKNIKIFELVLLTSMATVAASVFGILRIMKATPGLSLASIVKKTARQMTPKRVAHKTMRTHSKR